jgi:DNA-binding MarR family transcriptional regulator
MTTRRNNAVIAEETVNNLRRLFQIVNKQSKNVMFETGLTGPQLWAIKVLSDETGNTLTVSKLASRMCLNSSTVVRILDGLEEKDLVQRVRSVHDRRIVYVKLTDQGGTIISQSPDVAHNLLIRGLKSLSDNKLHTIASGLSQLINILDSLNISSQRVHAPENL